MGFDSSQDSNYRKNPRERRMFRRRAAQNPAQLAHKRSAPRAANGVARRGAPFPAQDLAPTPPPSRPLGPIYPVLSGRRKRGGIGWCREVELGGAGKECLVLVMGVGSSREERVWDWVLGGVAVVCRVERVWWIGLDFRGQGVENSMGTGLGGGWFCRPLPSSGRPGFLRRW